MTQVKNYPNFKFLAKETRNSMDIFDIDNTLVITQAKIKVDNLLTGEKYNLTPEEFNSFKMENHFSFDFSEFNDEKLLTEGIIIEDVFILLKKSIEKKKAVGIITAREKKSMIRKFLLKNGVDVNPKFIFTVGGQYNKKYKGTVAERKRQAFMDLMKLGFDNFTFYDDDVKNLKIAKSMEKEFNIKMKLIYIKDNGISKRQKN